MTIYDAAGWEALTASPNWAALLGLLAIAGLVSAIVYGWRESRLVPCGWAILLVLRVLAIAAAGLLLVGLERRVITETEEPSRIVLLTDRSASMQLPAGSDSSGSNQRSRVAAVAFSLAADQLAETQAVRTANFDVALAYTSPGADTHEPGASTRLGAAIERVLADHATTPLAAIVVASDGGWNAGPDPEAAAALAIRRGVPVHTLGVGPLSQPPQVSVRDLAAPARASAGDRFRTTVTLGANAEAASALPHRVGVTLVAIEEDGSLGAVAFQEEVEATIDPAGGLAAINVEIDTIAAGTYELIAVLTPSGEDTDAGDNRRTTRVELIDKPTRVLLAAGGPARDYRFLRDQLFRDALFSSDVLLQSAGGAVTQDADKVLTTLPTDNEGWEAYDAVVAIDLDWTLIDEATQTALADWVAGRGGGLVVVGGPVYTPTVVRRGLTPALQTLLPVTLRDDPLALNASIEASQEPQPIELTPAGRDTDFLRAPSSPDGADLWKRFEGVYATPLPAEAKPGATVLAQLGQSSEPRPPLCAEQYFGAGRVVYLATSETWRLRKVDPAWFTSLHTGLLRRVSQGRLLGGAAEGALLTDRDRYDLGEPIGVRYAARSPESIGDGGAGFVRLIDPAGESRELPLAPVDGQPGVFAAALRGESVGRYQAVYFTPGGQRLTTSAEVTLPSLESETAVQNVELLKAIASTSGGRYINLSDPDADEQIAQLAADTPSLAETTIQLSPPDAAFREWIAQLALAVMTAALLLEWLLRRSWRLA